MIIISIASPHNPKITRNFICAEASESKRQPDCLQDLQIDAKRQRSDGENTISFCRIDGIDNPFVSHENNQFYLFQGDMHLNKDLVIRYGDSDPFTMPCVS